LPIFYNYAKNIDIHILLYDSKEIKKAKQIQQGLKRFCDSHLYKPLLLLMPYEEDSIKSIKSVSESILKHSRFKKIYINPTEALSSTAVMLHKFLVEHDIYIIEYDRKENTCNILHNDKMQSIKLASMNIADHLMLKNIEISFRPNIKEIDNRKRYVLELMQDTKKYMQYRKERQRFGKKLTGFDNIKRLLRKTDMQNNTFFTDGAIFEEYCYHLLKEIDFDDIELGLKLTFLPQSSDSFENEFDILCIKDNHLHIVECKLRNSFNGEALVYKYDSVMNLLDEDAKVVLAIAGEDNIKTGKKNFTNGVYLRAKYQNILIYQEQPFNKERFTKSVSNYLLKG
jgi:hypothetical protein